MFGVAETYPKPGKRLRLALEKAPSYKPKTITELATHLEVSPQAVSQWLSGATVPRIEHAFRLEHLYGIDAEEWTR